MESKEKEYRFAAEQRYGTDQYLFAKQRDGFVEGAKWRDDHMENLLAQNRKLREALEKVNQMLDEPIDYPDRVENVGLFIEQILKETP